MSFIIDRVKPTDATELLKYLKQVGGETDNLTFGAEGLPFTEADEAAFLAQQQNSGDSLMLLAWADGVLVGNASLSRMPRRMCHRGNFAVSVLRDYWQQGIGSRLLQAVIDFARENGFGILDLEVRCDNQAAIRLYEKFGFRKLGTHPAFFRMDGADIPFDIMYLEL